MFRRPESMRERTLLRIIEQQQRTIGEQNDRIMFLSGRPWEVSPAELERVPEPDEPVSWTSSPEQDPVY